MLTLCAGPPPPVPRPVPGGLWAPNPTPLTRSPTAPKKLEDPLPTFWPSSLGSDSSFFSGGLGAGTSSKPSISAMLSRPTLFKGESDRRAVPLPFAAAVAQLATPFATSSHA